MGLIQKILIGIVAGTILGMLMTSFFLPSGSSLEDLFLTKITAPAIVTGFFCAIYAYYSKSKLQTFMISIFIGMLVYFIKYWITGHNFDPGVMGAFVGAIVGALFALIRKLTHSFKVYRRLEALRKRGFNQYSS